MKNEPLNSRACGPPGVICRDAIPAVVEQHVESLTTLWGIRQVLLESPHVALRHLARLDARIAAHLDGCLIAAESGRRLLQTQLANPGAAEIFAATVVALARRDRDMFQAYVSVAEAVPNALHGVSSALGWVSASQLAGAVNELLGDRSSLRRRLGLAACRQHGVEPRGMLPIALHDADWAVRVEALHCAVSLGCESLRSSCVAALRDDEPACRVWGAWAALLLGERQRAFDALTAAGMSEGPERSRAFRLALQAMSAAPAHSVLRNLATDGTQSRWLIEGSGIAGDPAYVPWLIGRMASNETARLAGEAFSLITGADIALLDLERRPPDDVEFGPNDDPDDSNVSMDADEGLPWPDRDRVETWWGANTFRFEPGTRYFVGAPVTRAHCIDVLKNGYQRQRILAAHYLCLLDPGTPLFDTSAPAWRQQRLLDRC